MSDRRAIVTGALGGIGAAVTEQLTTDHTVITHDLRAHHGRTPDVRSDLAARSGRDALVAAQGQEPLDLLAIAHGSAAPLPLPDLRPETVRQTMRVNFESVTELVEAFQPNLMAAGGVVVVVASQAGLTGEANHATYCASSFALVGWAREAVRQFAADDIRLRLVCPGAVDTPMFRGAIARWAADMGGQPETVLQQRVTQIPSGRLAAPAEIAAGVRYLAQLGTSELVVLNQSGGESFPR